MTTEKITSWSQLAALVEAYHDQRGWVFRGETKPDRPLLPKVGRLDSRKIAYTPGDETAALERFKLEARPHLQPTPENDLEWLAVAQHHGMSTRLMDWTESLLVAAYFAVEKMGTEGEGVIYGLHGLPDVTRADRERPLGTNTASIYRPPHISARIPAQRSVFVVFAAPTSPLRVSRGGGGAYPMLMEWRISGPELCAHIKRVLNACAINQASLFPGIDGLSRHIGWLYKWGTP